jgi:predicted dehydrogenase
MAAVKDRTWRVVGINFDHGHMEGLLRMVQEHPRAELVAVCDEEPSRIAGNVKTLGIPAERVYSDYRACLDATRPDIVVLCPATARHGVWVERVAPFGAHVIVEKPFAASLAEADRMIAAVAATGKQLVINWPLRWYPSHATTKRLIGEGRIGDPIEVHYYDGNRGPIFHAPELAAAPDTPREKRGSLTWFYRAKDGGGSLLDYLGYGTTLGTWFMNGAAPLAVTTVVDEQAGLAVDEHSVTIARYATGLSKFETRWGTFTDPWTLQPQPKCGFVVVGTAGTISSYDYEKTVRVQTRTNEGGEDVPVDEPKSPTRAPIEYVIDCLEGDMPVEGPLSPRISRIGQQIVDAARQSAAERRTVPLPA